jgi:plastocyanin
MKKNHFFAALALIFLSVLIIISCKKSSNSSYTPPSNPPNPTAVHDTVDMANMTFMPASITVAKGTVVVWINKDASTSHTVTSTDGTSFNSGNINGGGVYTFTTIAAGTFNYQCNYHVSMGMVGTLTVTP